MDRVAPRGGTDIATVLCDRKIPERLKSKIYRTVVRPVAMYGAECWPATKEVESRLSVMETKMLRWTAGVTRLDHVRNVSVRQRFGVAPIADKLREARLRWYGHVLRVDGDIVRKIGLNIDVPGKRPKGRPRQRWLDTLHVDLKEAGIHPDQAVRPWSPDNERLEFSGSTSFEFHSEMQNPPRLMTTAIASHSLTTYNFVPD
ncbi:unnamed protein product [Heligmosomoides polygyrus]|uniref:Reverse transcriptase n=1 Tax=Heligmosomoides polygyrus TaxID=6339 RepID=A0A3P7XSH7_HELPZ|nr:unnamed protein product [Heligmosomoides polygyrus]